MTLQPGHPVPVTMHPAVRAKVSDGLSVVVTAPVGGTEAGLFYLVENWFGAAFQRVAAGAPVALNIEQAEYQATADQMAAGTYTPGVLLYWDAAASRFTVVVGANRLVGRITSVTANVPAFVLFEQR